MAARFTPGTSLARAASSRSSFPRRPRRAREVSARPDAPRTAHLHVTARWSGAAGIELEELSGYFRQIRTYPPLTREEEHVLAVGSRHGDASAERKLVLHNLAFVVAIARKQRRGTVRLDDLVREGNVGLMRAVEKFDPHVGTRFSTYRLVDPSLRGQKPEGGALDGPSPERRRCAT